MKDPETLAMTIFLRPFIGLFVFACIVWPIKRLIWGRMKPGRLRDLLFRPLWTTKEPGGGTAGSASIIAKGLVKRLRSWCHRTPK